MHLIGVVASNPDNTADLRLHLLHHQLADLIKAAAVPVRSPGLELLEIAVLATGTACALLARRFAFGRRRKIEPHVALSFVDSGVFVAAAAFAQYTSLSCQHFGLRLLLLGLESNIPQVWNPYASCAARHHPGALMLSLQAGFMSVYASRRGHSGCIQRASLPFAMGFSMCAPDRMTN